MHNHDIGQEEHLQNPIDMTQLTGDVSWSSGTTRYIRSLGQLSVFTYKLAKTDPGSKQSHFFFGW